jgi:hypothetical protein
MEVWVLWLTLARQPRLDLGEYFSEGHCEIAAVLQMPHWRGVYGNRMKGWRCIKAHVDWRQRKD